jgi:hypothetical protein
MFFVVRNAERKREVSYDASLQAAAMTADQPQVGPLAVGVHITTFDDSLL